jgi:tight adherence protein B
MSNGVPWLMMTLSFLCLIGFGVSGLMVSAAHARREKWNQRMRETVQPFRKVRFTELRAFTPPAAEGKSLVETATSVLGFSLARGDQYPAPWWLVLMVTLVVARLVAGFVVSIVGEFGIIAMPVLWILQCRIFFGWVVARRNAALIGQFPDTLDMIVRSVKVGIPVLGAIGTVAREAPEPTAGEFRRLGNDLAIGVPLDQAVTKMGARNDLSEYRFFATALALQAQTGGALSETLDNLSDVIRKRIALKERGLALSAEARTSALVLGGLPVVMGAALWALNPSYMGVLLDSNVGQKILGAALLSLSCGAITMKVVISKSLS